MSKKQKTWHIRIGHMVDAISLIEKFTENFDDEENFYEDIKAVSAVERQFQILGDASKAIPDHIRIKYDHIEWRDIKEMRNFIVHDYDDVEHYVLWNTIQEYLPDLKDKLQKLKEDIENDQNQ